MNEINDSIILNQEITQKKKLGRTNNVYFCPICNEKFTNNIKFKRHKIECYKANGITFRCCFGCGREFSNKRSLSVHEAYCQNNPNRVINVPKNKGKKIVNHKNKICLYCGNEFYPYYKKSNGSEYYSPKRKFCCQTCATKYYQEHGKSEKAKIYNHICSICGKNKKSKKEYSKNKNYICLECRKEIASLKRGYSICPICGQLNCVDERCKINEMLKKLRVTAKIFKNDFDSSKIGTIEIHDEIKKLKTKLEEMYFDKKMSIVEIANIYNVPFNKIKYQFINLFNISLRTKKEVFEIQQNKLFKINDKWKANFNPKGCDYIDMLNEKYGYNFQHALNGGEKQVKWFWIDGYDEERNIAFEYDEQKHYKDYKNNILTDKDIERMYLIHEELECRFLRYNEKLDKLYEFEFS